MKHTDRNRKNIGNCNWLRRALPVVLSALLLCSLTGCSVRDLHIGQVEVNTGIATAWITPAKGVDKFAIAAGDFSVRDDGTVTYTGTAYRALQGIDVSTFQQEIDWQAVADSGIDFAFIRAGYRGYGKGGIVEDDRFRQNAAGARAAGLRVGLYFFSQAITPEEAAEEAQWLVDAAQDFKIDMPLVFDWENIDPSSVASGDTVRTAEMTGEDVTACAAAFCAAVEAASYDFANATADVTDINGHGTATAGLVADLTPDAVDVMVLRVYDDNNMSKASRVLTALEYALENGAAVVNLSLGWTNAIEKGYSFLNSVLAQAYASGVVVVAAAGNRSQNNPTGNADDVYPANQEAVLTVSGVNRSRAFDSSYSSSGTAVDLCAPGSNVVVAAPGGGTSVRSGTSFAAPHIAAAAACVRLAQPGLSAAGVRQMLYRYADDLGDPGRDDAYGYGLPVLTRYFHDRLCPGQRFRDMPASDIWSHEGLDYCIAAGLISGTSEVTVSPDMLATRAQIVQLLWAAAGSPETAGTLPFTDVSTDAWFYPAVRWAYRTGLVSGTSETTFDPEAPITRQDFALILYTQSGSPAMTGSVLRDFPDVEQVSGYAYAALTWAVEQGLINGVGTPEGALLAPHGYASRAQVATILMAYCDR